MIPATRLIPTPFLTLLLVAVWLMLQNSLSPGNIIMAVILGIALPRLTYRFWDRQPDVQRPWLLIRYILRLIGDIIVANYEVSKLVLSPWHKPKPYFVVYPLSMTDHFAITVLTSTISLTPGTISAHFRLHEGTVLIHALDLEDEEALINEIYERYEKPLKEIFGC
ncbi:Na+/H+ antiporter subunit E [Larsenimonas suaedae]|uniref:Na+/H+ antiporter subunit E n=1 Tax=Larsenimonas suaedae TaxID=1851019 RepID=A0ABU1GTP3_9GAMM|nr:Na+/H+ antiporter subunit E [Larsenimonas suaedae]MCM2971847.1 Na+/H+ antiporter subunit E [Larsenimonas suaedae]MDR5895399.1 Na+/H+ antiporter subunit E [Larsenimonas suaedae]